PLRSTCLCGHDGPRLTTEMSTAGADPCWVKYGPPESFLHGLVVRRGDRPVVPTYPRLRETILNWPVCRWVARLDASSSTVRPKPASRTTVPITGAVRFSRAGVMSVTG